MKKILILLTLAISASGCESMPKLQLSGVSGGYAPQQTVQEMESDTKDFTLPKLPEQDKAIVYIVRPPSPGTILSFNVFLDDQNSNSEMGSTLGSQYIFFNLNPGEHTILSKAENLAELKVTIKTGEILFLRQESTLGLLTARNSLKIITATEGKYHIKRFTPGTIIKTDK